MKSIKLLILIILMLFLTKNENVLCVTSMTIIEKKSYLIAVILNDYPEIKNQAIDLIYLLNEQISNDLCYLDNKQSIKKYAYFIKILCLITTFKYNTTTGYTCEIKELIDCHKKHFDNWFDFFFYDKSRNFNYV